MLSGSSTKVTMTSRKSPGCGGFGSLNVRVGFRSSAVMEQDLWKHDIKSSVNSNTKPYPHNLVCQLQWWSEVENEDSLRKTMERKLCVSRKVW